MAGIYIHIPFCKQQCHYCDFHKSTVLSGKEEMIRAIKKECKQRKNYFGGKSIETIYLGGGTPSVLDTAEVNDLLTFIRKEFEVTGSAEITFEANPDDLSLDYCKQLICAGINRLSIGIQSFDDDDLKLMNRRHSASQAIKSVHNAREAGFKNLSVDLIYGFPGMDADKWRKNLETLFFLNVQHISSYHLTYHEHTVFYDWLQREKIFPVDEEESLEQFKMLIEGARKNGFEHYEISNFALPGFYSKHNTSYWQGKKYLGLGPSAHSFDGQSRQWNTASNNAYIKAIQKEEPVFEKEVLSLTDKYNDYIITRIRTQWGVDFTEIETLFGSSYAAYAKKGITKYVHSKHAALEGNRARLSSEGLFISDEIMATLFMGHE